MRGEGAGVEEAVAGEFELGSVVEECEWYGTWDMRERTRAEESLVFSLKEERGRARYKRKEKGGRLAEKKSSPKHKNRQKRKDAQSPAPFGMQTS